MSKTELKNKIQDFDRKMAWIFSLLHFARKKGLRTQSKLRKQVSREILDKKIMTGDEFCLLWDYITELRMV